MMIQQRKRQMRPVSGNSGTLRAHAQEGGSVLVELTIVLPVLLLIFAALAAVGILLMQIHMVTDATRQGARFGAWLSNYDPYANPPQSPRQCNQIAMIAGYETIKFRDEFVKENKLGYAFINWTTPVATVQTAFYDGYSVQTLDLQLKSKAEECRFCIMKYLLPDQVPARSTFLLDMPCNVTSGGQ